MSTQHLFDLPVMEGKLYIFFSQLQTLQQRNNIDTNQTIMSYTSTIMNSNSNNRPSLKRKRFSGNITDNINTSLPARKVIRVTSSLPDRLVARKESQSTCNPQQCLESILSQKGLPVATFAYDQIPNFFQNSNQDNSSWDFDVLKAVRQGDVEELRRLQESGRSLSCSNNFGETLLHLASRKAMVPVIDFLVHEANVPVAVVDDMGRTPLHDAFWTPEPNFELIDLLVSKCPDLLFVKDKRGHTPLSFTRKSHWAKWSEYLKSRSHLLQPVSLNVRKQ